MTINSSAFRFAMFIPPGRTNAYFFFAFGGVKGEKQKHSKR